MFLIYRTCKKNRECIFEDEINLQSTANPQLSYPVHTFVFYRNIQEYA